MNQSLQIFTTAYVLVLGKGLLLARGSLRECCVPMRHLLHILEPGAILIALIVVSSLTITLVRGFQIPQCFYCGAAKVRPSRPAGFWDGLAMIILVRPYRCLGCRVRFHAIRPFGSTNF